MPKDQWARDKAKRIGKAAIASGEFDRIEKPKKKSKRQKRLGKRSRREEMRASGLCPKCVNSYVNKEVVTFSNGTMHVKQTCATCGKFIKFGE